MVFLVKRFRGKRERASSGHALALARWEPNNNNWLEGNQFELTSRATDLQDLVGSGGTLWVVVSRRMGGKAHYALLFRFMNCRNRTHQDGRGFGRFSVVGDKHASVLFASNDAKYPLLTLRFDPPRPIDHARDRERVIGNAL